MGYKFLFYISNNLFFEADVQCMQCEGTSKNGNQCRRRVCIGTPFCWQHLASEKKLKIKQSNIANAGKGLFAWNPKNPNEVIFKRARTTRFQNTPGQKIVEYAGELKILIISTTNVYPNYFLNSTGQVNFLKS